MNPMLQRQALTRSFLEKCVYDPEIGEVPWFESLGIATTSQAAAGGGTGCRRSDQVMNPAMPRAKIEGKLKRWMKA